MLEFTYLSRKGITYEIRKNNNFTMKYRTDRTLFSYVKQKIKHDFIRGKLNSVMKSHLFCEISNRK